MKTATYVRCFLVIMMTMLPSLAEAKKFHLKTLQDYAQSLEGQPVSTLVEKWGTPIQDYTSPETGVHIIKWKHWEEGAGAWMAAGGSCELDFTVDDKDSTIKSFMSAETSGHLPTALTLAPHPCKFFLPKSLKRTQQVGSAPRTDSPIEVSKAAPAATPSPSAAVQKGDVSRHYRIGIFPAAGNFGVQNRSTQEKGSADILAAVIRTKKEFVLSYSDYQAELREPRIKPGDAYRLWTEDVIRRKPDREKVCSIARQRNLDAVVMAWGDTPEGWGAGFFGDDSRNPVFIYLIDVEQRRAYRQKGTFADIPRMGELVLTDFLKNRPEVIRAKAAPATK